MPATFHPPLVRVSRSRRVCWHLHPPFVRVSVQGPSSSCLRIAFVFDEGRVCRPTSHPPPLVCASRSRLMRGGCAGHLPPSSRLRTTFNEEGVPATSTLLLFASSVTGGCTCAPHPRFVCVRFEEGVQSPPPLVCISGSVRVPTLLSFVYRVR